MEIPANYKERVVGSLLERRGLYGGSDDAFARSMGLNKSVYNRLKNGERERLLKEAKWLSLGRLLGVSIRDESWKVVETDVYMQIREEILFGKEFSSSRIFVDNCGIGKTYTAKHVARTTQNVFYVDCTQSKGKRAFIRALAQAIGVESRGTLEEIKENTKYYLTILEKPLVVIDEAGALEKDALGLLQEYWNYTEGACGWYMMGANALRNKIAMGVSRDRDYFAELFSRFSEKFSAIIPTGKEDKRAFYRKLITEVLSANLSDKSRLNELVKQCLIEDENGYISGLRRAKTLLQLYNAQ